jgi:hypothetical protein
MAVTGRRDTERHVEKRRKPDWLLGNGRFVLVIAARIATDDGMPFDPPLPPSTL